LLLVPIDRLYDHGLTVTCSEMLHPRLAKQEIRVAPQEAGERGFAEGANIDVNLNGETYRLCVAFDDTVPAGVALVPRSMGVPLNGPVPIDARAMERGE
jgi:hypothetical protein